MMIDILLEYVPLWYIIGSLITMSWIVFWGRLPQTIICWINFIGYAIIWPLYWVTLTGSTIRYLIKN